MRSRHRCAVSQEVAVREPAEDVGKLDHGSWP
jgi:hypothetical protein